MVQIDYTSIDKMIEKYGGNQSALIQSLQDIQGVYRYLPKDALVYLSQKMNIPLANIYNVATFYQAFSLRERGEHIVSVCLGTACHVRGSVRILEGVERKIHCKANDTTKDGKWTLETVNCLGSCALGPLVVIDGNYHGKATTTAIDKVLDEVEKSKAEPESGKSKSN